MSITNETRQEKVIKCDICGREVIRESSSPAFYGVEKKAKHFCSLHLREEKIWTDLKDLNLVSTETEFWKEVKKV